jgi:hypothetical protein
LLCQTDDAGRTWRPTLYGGERFFTYVRVSRRVGAAITGGRIVQKSPPSVDSWWDAIFTLDGGKHWFAQHLTINVPEGQKDANPWGCWKKGCPPPSFRLGRVHGKRALLSDAPDAHTYVVEGLWKHPSNAQCHRGLTPAYASIGPRNICAIPPAGGLWLRRLR